VRGAIRRRVVQEVRGRGGRGRGGDAPGFAGRGGGHRGRLAAVGWGGVGPGGRGGAGGGHAAGWEDQGRFGGRDAKRARPTDRRTPRRRLGVATQEATHFAQGVQAAHAAAGARRKEVGRVCVGGYEFWRVEKERVRERHPAAGPRRALARPPVSSLRRTHQFFFFLSLRGEVGLPTVRSPPLHTHTHMTSRPSQPGASQQGVRRGRRREGFFQRGRARAPVPARSLSFQSTISPFCPSSPRPPPTQTPPAPPPRPPATSPPTPPCPQPPTRTRPTPSSGPPRRPACSCRPSLSPLPPMEGMEGEEEGRAPRPPPSGAGPRP